MNAIVTLESILTPAAVPLSAETLFGTGQIETIVSAIETQVRGEVIDISTAAGRDAAKSLAHKIARSKGILDEIGKEHVAEIKKLSGSIDAERKTLRDRLDALKAEVRGPVELWEEDEANRVSAHEGALVSVIEAARQAAGKSASLIREIIVIVEGYRARDWQEFKERADVAVTEALETLNAALADAEQRERDAAELAELRRLKAEREEADAKAAWQAAENERIRKAAEEAAERAERERLAQAERDRIAAEQAAERERLHAERLETMKREQEELAKRQAAEAAARAVEAERKRVAEEAAAKLAADQKRAENKRRRDKVHAEIGNALTMEGGLTGEQVDCLIDAITNGRVPHVSVTY